VVEAVVVPIKNMEHSPLETPKQPPKSSDGRLKGYFGNVTHATLPMEQVYCFLCGAKAGFVSRESSKLIAPQHVAVTCDRCDHDIIAKYGNLPMEQVPVHLYDAFGYKPERSPKET
jgi:hypothetical protein